MERKLKENWFNDLKVGDKVKVISKTRKVTYPVLFTPAMQQQKNKIFTIKEIKDAPLYCRYPTNGDTRLYRFTIGSNYNWHSLMFEPVDDRFYEEFFIPEFKIVL